MTHVAHPLLDDLETDLSLWPFAYSHDGIMYKHPVAKREGEGETCVLHYSQKQRLKVKQPPA